MDTKKVLICGATGFIGRNTLEALTQVPHLQITGTYFSNPPGYQPIEMVQADLTKRDDVDKVVKGKDIIIQMAAVTSGAKDIAERPYIHVTDNAVMNSLLLRAAFDHKVKHFIFPSSSSVYPSSEKPVNENCPIEINPKYFGGAHTKLYLEKMCEFYSTLGRTKHTVMRQANIYGPHDKFDLEKSHVFGATITKVMSAPENSAIQVWGTGEEERDLLYVSDLTDFIKTAINTQSSPFELVNISSGKSISVSNLVKKIIEISGKSIKIKYDSSKPSIKTKLALNPTRASEQFDWRPKISLDKGIKTTIDWYSHNI
jgi:GDP-L-fucose synthase